MPDPWETLKLLSDPTRLRMINLLLRDELSVAELQNILDMGQSRVSSHLSQLRQANLVLDRKDGKKTFYRLNPSNPREVKTLVRSACDSVSETNFFQEDIKNLNRILAQRRQVQEQYFNTVAGKLGKNYCPGRSWEAIGRALVYLVPDLDIADLGAGEGLLSLLLSKNARKVCCVDASARMVQIGTENARKNGVENLSYILGNIEAVPLEDESFDLAVLSQALHHAQKPEIALQEAYRILRPGGKILIIDLKQHPFEKARELYADIWLGFSENNLYQLLQQCGFQKIEVSVAAREEVEPHFETIISVGLRPE